MAIKHNTKACTVKAYWVDTLTPIGDITLAVYQDSNGTPVIQFNETNRKLFADRPVAFEIELTKDDPAIYFYDPESQGEDAPAILSESIGDMDKTRFRELVQL